MTNDGRARHAAARSTPWQVWAVVATLATLALGIWLGPGLHVTFRQAGFHLPLIAFIAVAAGADALRVEFEFRRHTFGFLFSEVALVFSLVFFRPEAVLIGGAIGSAIPWAIRRVGPARFSFNVTSRVLEFGLGRVIYAALAPTTSLLSPAGWLAGFTAVFVNYLVIQTGVLTVVRLTTGPLPRRQVAAQSLLNLIVSACITAIAMLAAIILWSQPWAAMLMALLIIVMALAYRAHTILRQHYTNLRLLFTFAAALADAHTEDEVIAAILRQSAEMLNAENADLTLPAGRGFVRLELDGTDITHAGPVEPDPMATAALLDPDGVLIAAKGHHPLRGIADELDYRDVVAVAISLEDGQTGALVVGNRSTNVKSFDTEDLRLLRALAAHASVALRNGQLVDRLTEEAITRTHQALHDSLTGMGNRSLFIDQTQAALDAPGHHVTGVILMDLDDFKEVNDTLGHHTGDSVLREIASRLARAPGQAPRSPGSAATSSSCCRVVRVGGRGDGRGVAPAPGGEQPVHVDGLTLEVQASIGVAVAPEHGNDPTILLQHADIAMYAAKDSRQGVELYDASDDHYSTRRLALTGDLREAMVAGDLTLAYQPKVDLSTGEIIGVEALLAGPTRATGSSRPTSSSRSPSSPGSSSPSPAWSSTPPSTNSSGGGPATSISPCR